MTSTNAVPAAAAINHIEQLAKNYREALDTLTERVAACEDEIRAVQNRRAQNIRLAVAATLDAQAKVLAAVDARRDLFVQPRSMTLSGIMLGVAKGRGRTLWPKAEKLLATMKRVFCPATYKALVVTVEEPNKQALRALPVPELKKLGVTIEATGDAPFAKPAKSTISEQVERMLDDAAEEMAEKARAALVA